MIWAEPVQIEHICLQFHFPPHHGVLGRGAIKTILKAMKPTCNAIPIYSHRRAITHVFQFRRRPIWALKFLLLLPSLGFATRLLLSSPPGLCPRTVSRSSGGWRACGATSWNQSTSATRAVLHGRGGGGREQRCRHVVNAYVCLHRQFYLSCPTEL